MKSTSGYTLLEALVAACLLLMVVAAAASLSAGMNTQDQLSQQGAVALNYQEQAARLWQLGMNATDIYGADGILPTNPAIGNLTFTTSNTTLDDGAGTVFTVSQADCTVSFTIDESADTRDNTIILVRPIAPTP